MENSRDQLSTFSRGKLFMKDNGKSDDEQNRRDLDEEEDGESRLVI